MPGSLTQEKICLSCGKPVKGRADKKFCDDYCRNNYNNAQKGGSVNLIRNVNNALRKNRKILSDYLKGGEETVRTHRNKLQAAGFQFKYITSQYQTKKGDTYFFCYDYGYLRLNDDWYLLVREKMDKTQQLPDFVQQV